MWSLHVTPTQNPYTRLLHRTVVRDFYTTNSIYGIGLIEHLFMVLSKAQILQNAKDL